MFSRKDLECLDPGYFEIIYMDDRDVTIMSRNTRHVWYIHKVLVDTVMNDGVCRCHGYCIDE